MDVGVVKAFHVNGQFRQTKILFHLLENAVAVLFWVFDFFLLGFVESVKFGVAQRKFYQLFLISPLRYMHTKIRECKIKREVGNDFFRDAFKPCAQFGQHITKNFFPRFVQFFLDLAGIGVNDGPVVDDEIIYKGSIMFFDQGAHVHFMNARRNDGAFGLKMFQILNFYL